MRGPKPCDREMPIGRFMFHFRTHLSRVVPQLVDISHPNDPRKRRAFRRIRQARRLLPIAGHDRTSQSRPLAGRRRCGSFEGLLRPVSSENPNSRFSSSRRIGRPSTMYRPKPIVGPSRPIDRPVRPVCERQAVMNAPFERVDRCMTAGNRRLIAFPAPWDLNVLNCRYIRKESVIRITRLVAFIRITPV